MGKVYDFKSHQREREKKSVVFTPNGQYRASQKIMEEAIEVLIFSYEARIEEIKKNKEEIKHLDGVQLHNPKEVLKQVQKLDQVFKTYGLAANYYRFVTLKDTQVLYFNDTSLIYVYKGNKIEKAKGYRVQEFILEFEGYSFTSLLDQEVYNVLDAHIKRLEITIDTLKNTQ